MIHKAVLLQEALEALALKPGMTVVDGTLGSAGHSIEIAKALGPQGKLIALDQDEAAIQRGQEKLKGFSQVCFFQNNFRELPDVLEQLNVDQINAVLLDIGFSSDQLEDPERGFSFEREGPLDMRMNRRQKMTAKDLIHDLSKEELEKIFREYGEERWARRYAERICEVRRETSIETTQQLVEVIRRARPAFKKKPKKPLRGKRKNPATRVFQALRIAVNDELHALSEGLQYAFEKLAGGGRLVVISFHSLEDRIVKNQFRDWHKEGIGKLIYKKPVTANREETLENPRARSAKLRAVEKR